MARYTGPKNRINRKFGEPILGSGKNLDKNSFPPGHARQLQEAQDAV